jgi:hypothetical protein
MVQFRYCGRLTLEPFGELLFRNLDGYDPIQTSVTRLVDLAHAAGADGCKNLVGPQSSGAQRHVSNNSTSPRRVNHRARD